MLRDVATGRAIVPVRAAVNGQSARPGTLNAVQLPDSLVYLDHAATTPMRPEAVEVMLPFLSERFANPSGSHRFARSGAPSDR